MIFALLVIYQIKHFVCDYPLQGKFMLGKFLDYPKFVLPLLAHTAVHAIATFCIALCFKSFSIALSLALFDMGVHFVVDRIKASPKLLGRFKPLTASTYKMALNMSLGISMVDGKPLPKRIEPETLEMYKASGRKEIRDNTFFWWSLGADQMAHHLTHYIIIWCLL